MTYQGKANIMTCNACNTTIYDRHMSKTSPDNKIWHSNCLKCCECNQLLDSKYFETRGRLYCRNDYLTNYGPSCSGCGCKINDEQYFFSVKSSIATFIDANHHNSSLHNTNTDTQQQQQLTGSQTSINTSNGNDTIGSNTMINISSNNSNGNTTSTTCHLFFHDKCFLCNYCARPLQKGDRYCILDKPQASTLAQKSLMICHDTCALKFHSTKFNNNINTQSPENQMIPTKTATPRARRGRMKQTRPT